MRKILLTVLFCLPLRLAADGLPDLGDVAQTALTPQMEQQIGEQSMFQIRASERYLDDPELTDYLNRLGDRLVAHSSEPSQPFKFFLMDDNAINAFALPGGFIGVNTGLILLAQNESELASVLSHEISHVTQHHLARMVAGQQYDSLAAMATVAVAILAARNNPQATSAAIVGAQGGVMQRQLDFTREHEKEADRIGLAMLQQAGYDTRAMPAFFQRMQQATQIHEGGTPTWLRTHPLTSERVADVDSRVQQIPYKLVPDNLDFQLMRARILARQGSARDAVLHFEQALGERRFGNPLAQRYGLVLALLREGQLARARHELTPLAQALPGHATVDALAGQIKRALNDTDTSDFYAKALKQHPAHRALAYDYAELLLETGQHKTALALLEEQVARNENDPKLYELQARAYGALGRHQEEHHALSYYHILHGRLLPAIEQLELAQRSGNDYYQLSTIEAELKHYRAILDALRASKKSRN